jgi:heptosyltransferase III
MKKPNKALFIQLRRIGDMLMCTPSIRAFKKTYPVCRLDILTEHPQVLQGNPHINKIIDVDPSRQFDPIYQFNLIRSIKEERYDLVVDFLANPRSAYYAFLSGADTRLSYGFGHRRWAYNLVPRKPIGSLYAAIDKLKLLEAIEVDPDGPDLEFYPTKTDRKEADNIVQSKMDRPLITISPVSRRIHRRWPLENYARLADLLIEKLDAEIMILAGPGEEEFADKVASSMASVACVPKIQSLSVLGAIFEKVALHIGNDNGPKHIAVACGAPTFAIFGPQDPISWTFPDPSRHRWVSPLEFCDQCHSGAHNPTVDCLAKIPVEEVYKRVSDMTGTLPGFKKSIPEQA